MYAAKTLRCRSCKAVKTFKDVRKKSSKSHVQRASGISLPKPTAFTKIMTLGYSLDKTHQTFPLVYKPPCRLAAKATRVSVSQCEGTLCTNLEMTMDIFCKKIYSGQWSIPQRPRNHEGKHTRSPSRGKKYSSMATKWWDMWQPGYLSAVD